MSSKVLKRKVGPYVLLEKIDICANGEVFRSITTESSDILAIKMLMKNAMDQKELDEAEREVETLQFLSSDNIVQMRDIRNSENHYYIIFDYHNGGNLDSYQKERGGRLPEAKARYISARVLQGLAAMHKLGATHRNLNPRKVLLHYPNEDSRAKDEPCVRLCGLRAAHLPQFSETGFEEQHTRLENVAPEVLSGQPFTDYADVWSLGTMVYEMLFGVPPFAAPDKEGLLAKVVGEGSFSIPAKISVEALSFLSSCLQCDPSNRPSAETLLKLPFVAGPAKTSELDMERFCQEHGLAAKYPFTLTCKGAYDFPILEAGPREPVDEVKEAGKGKGKVEEGKKEEKKEEGKKEEEKREEEKKEEEKKKEEKKEEEKKEEGKEEEEEKEKPEVPTALAAAAVPDLQPQSQAPAQPESASTVIVQAPVPATDTADAKPEEEKPAEKEDKVVLPNQIEQPSQLSQTALPAVPEAKTDAESLRLVSLGETPIPEEKKGSTSGENPFSELQPDPHKEEEVSEPLEEEKKIPGPIVVPTKKKAMHDSNGSGSEGFEDLGFEAVALEKESVGKCGG